MKKILLLVLLFVVSIGFSQNLQDFESTAAINGAPFGGMPVPVFETGTGSNTSQVLKFVTNPNIAAAGVEPWQGINLNISSVNLTVNKTLYIDVLSSTPITFLAKVTTGGAIAAAPVTHNGDGTWQTLSFTFNTALDGQAANPSGTYSGFVIHPYWEVGRTQFFTPTVVPTPARTFYVDNIRETAPAPPISGNIYINDNSTADDVFTSAVGQNIGTATGSASLPYQSLTDLFNDRDVAAGSTIHLDSGTYSGRITFSDTEDGSSGNIMTIKGAGTGLTTLSSSLAAGSLIATNGADYMTFQDMTITAGNESNAILLDGTSTNCTFNNLKITTNNRGIVITAGSNSTTITKNNINGDNSNVDDYGIFFSGASNSHSVSNNMVSNFAHVFRSDNTGTINCNIYHNSFYANQYAFVGFVTGWDIRNNIFYTTSNDASLHTAFWYGGDQSPSTLDNNLYYHPNAARAVTRYFQSTPNDVYPLLSDFVAATAFEDNGVEGNPLFVDPANGDLRLQVGSPAIDAGADAGVTEDIDGDTRPISGSFDMGADEFSSVPVTGDVYINDGTFDAGDFTTAAGQDIATNDGSAAEPFATLDYALSRSTLAPGDVIYIDAGTYSWASTHELTDSGTLANPITIQGKGSATDITTTASSTTSAGLHFTTGEHWVVKDLNWTATAARTVWVANVDGIILDNCNFNFTSASTSLQSIIINNADGELTIRNCTIERSNTAFHMIEVVEGTTLIMQDNIVSFPNTAPSGTASSVQLRTNSSSVFIIERNRFRGGGYGIGNVVGTAGPVNANSIIKNNFFNSFWGIVTTMVQGLTVHNNSFYTNGESIYGINAGSLTNWDIRNNILYTYGSLRTCVMSGSTTSHPAIMDYNYYYSPNTGAARQGSTSGSILSFTQWQNAAGGPWEQNGQGGNAVSFDPLYVDPANGDLRLQSGSPAIDAGVDVGITDDIDGNSRPISGAFDMGAAEYVPVIDDATLSVLEVDGVSVPNFNSNTYDYTLTVPFGSTPQITLATTSSPAASAVINQSPSIPVDATVVVTAEDGITQQTYRVSFEVLQQFIIQDFEDSGTFNQLTGDNGITSTIVTPPAGNNNGGQQCLRLDSSASGQVFQAGYFTQLVNFVHFTQSNTVELDVYSDQAFDLLLKLEAGGPDTQVSQAYTTPNTWQTLTYTFVGAHPVNPNGIYERIVFFPNSNGTNDGFDASQNFTVYIDNITASSNRNYYIYDSNAWTPLLPVGNSGPTDNILVVDGEPEINGLLEGDFLQVLSGATLNIASSSTLDLAGDIINDGNIVFKSDITGSGQLAEFRGSINPTGNITSERFIPAGEGNGNRAFRYLASSINTTESIFDNWQEAGNSPSNLGTHITGIQGTPGSFDATTGLDFTLTGNSSMFGFNNDTGQWFGVGNTKTTDLIAGVPYAIMIRGDRNTDLTTNTPAASNTVLRAKGDLQTGNVTETFTQSDSFVLVGNPYQAIVDLTKIDYTGVYGDEFYIWDPNLGDNDNGAYVTVTTATGVPDPSSSAANEFLQPGQAVFMLTNNSSGPHEITFTEKAKSTSVLQTDVFSTSSIPYLNMRLYTTARYNSGGNEHDAIGLRLHSENTVHQFRNARKLGNTAETMAFLTDNSFASIQHAALGLEENQFPIYIGSYQHQDYTFWFNLANLPEDTSVFLKDNYLDESIELEEGENSVSFDVDTSINGSFSTTRFSIEFDVETLSNSNFDSQVIQFYPNPTTDFLQVNLGNIQANQLHLSIYDITGRRLMDSVLEKNESVFKIDMSKYNSGLYLVEINDGNKIYTSKVIKN